MYTLSSPYHHHWCSHLSSHRGRSIHQTFATLNTHSSPTISTITPTTTISKPLDPSLRSTWSHRAWVAVGSTSVLSAFVNSAIASADSGAVIEPIITTILGYIIADLGSGFYHFAIDNYGGPSTPIFGSQIEAFQGHHRRPSTITRRQPANNLHSLARAVALFVIPLELAVGSGGATSAAVHAFIGSCAGCIMLSQQFHAWAHSTRVPRMVEMLQGLGVLVSRKMHGAHHRVPYNNNYCIVSGIWNGVLDEYRVFEVVELLVFFKFGVRPRSWEETAVEWREEENDGESL